MIKYVKYVYVMGTSHSGSTLLAFLLNAHPEIVSIGETSPSLKRNKDRHLLPCSCGELIGECPFWNKVFDEVTAQGIIWTPRQWAMMFQDNKLLRDLFLSFTRSSCKGTITANVYAVFGTS